MLQLVVGASCLAVLGAAIPAVVPHANADEYGSCTGGTVFPNALTAQWSWNGTQWQVYLDGTVTPWLLDTSATVPVYLETSAGTSSYVGTAGWSSGQYVWAFPVAQAVLGLNQPGDTATFWLDFPIPLQPDRATCAITGYYQAPPAQPTPTPPPAPSLKTYTVTLGQPFNLTLTGGTPYLQEQWQVSYDGAAWSTLATVTLDASGNSTYAFTPAQTAYYRAYTPSSGQSSSWELEVIVQQPAQTPAPTPTLQVHTITLGQPYDLGLTGGTPYEQVQWQTSPDDVNWASLTTVTLDASGSSTYAITPTQTAYYRIYVPSSGQYGSWVTEVIVQQPAPTAPPPTSVSVGSALGLTASGPFSSTTKVQQLGKYVTWQFSFGPAAAGQTVRIWLASRSGTTWSRFTVLTARIADSAGHAYVHWRYSSAAWISLRAELGTTFTAARQARWE